MAFNIASPLLTATALQTVLGQPHVKLFDVRGIWGSNPRGLYEEYISGHIPTAVFLNWRTEFIEPNIAPNLAQISSYTEAKQSFHTLGIDKGDTVILYDDHYHMFAGRIWWAMRYWGFDNVYVLNGGLTYWKSLGLPISQEIPKVSKGTFEPQLQQQLRIALPEFEIEKNNACVLDGRGSAAYHGKPEDPRTGHIPGAISAAYNTLVDNNTRLFIDDESLIALFDKTIPNWRTQHIIASCGSGYSGTVVMLALAHLGVSSCLFDESFSVWKQDPKRQVEQSY